MVADTLRYKSFKQMIQCSSLYLKTVFSIVHSIIIPSDMTVTGLTAVVDLGGKWVKPPLRRNFAWCPYSGIRLILQFRQKVAPKREGILSHGPSLFRD